MEKNKEKGFLEGVGGIPGVLGCTRRDKGRREKDFSNKENKKQKIKSAR